MPTTARRSAASGRRYSLSSRLVATLLTALLGSVPAVSVTAQDEGEPEMNAATARNSTRPLSPPPSRPRRTPSR